MCLLSAFTIQFTKASFFPYLEDSINALLAEHIGALQSYHDSIRAEALICLEQLVGVAVAQHGPNDTPLRGVCIQLHPVVQEMCKVSLSTYINVMCEDCEKEPVARACEGVAAILQRVGVVALTITTDDKKRMIDPLMQMVSQLIHEKANCQTATQYEHHEGDEDDDHDSIVMDSVCDLIGTFAKCMGSEFIPYFDQFLKPLLKFTKPSRLHSDRAMVIGCFAEVVGELGSVSVKYADGLLPVIKAGLADEMEGVRRNSAYCVGTLVEATETALSPHVLPLLQCLHPLCIRPAHQQGSDMGGADVDNAIAAVARIIKAMPTVAPIAQVLPVLVANLPFRVDFEECEHVYGMLAGLIQQNDPTILHSLLPQVLTLFADTLSSSKYNDASKAVVRSCVQSMVQNPDIRTLFVNAVNQVNDPNVKQILEQAAN